MLKMNYLINNKQLKLWGNFCLWISTSEILTTRIDDGVTET